MATDWALPQINMNRCNCCGVCAQLCPADAVELGAMGPFIARPEDCTYCTDCEASCPEGAITCPYEIVWGTGVD